MKKILSFILPVFNEEANILLIYATLKNILIFLPKYDYEIIFVNDGSTDGSWNLIQTLIGKDPYVKGMQFSRNFGHQIALTAGYDHAQGDAIITMDTDLQDPPELVLEMIKKWEQGSHIVYARRIDRKDTFLKRITATLYYRLLNVIADVVIPRNVGDFRLIDKKVLMILQHCRERSRYLRGLVAWTGFSCDFVDFQRPNRLHGQTGYTWKKMLKLASDGITGFSVFLCGLQHMWDFLLLLRVYYCCCMS